MIHRIFAFAAALLFLALGVSIAPAQTAAPGPAVSAAEQAPAASAAPASAPAEGPTRATSRRAVQDHCRTILEDYDTARERGRFLAAAGVENEMDEKAFEADKAKWDANDSAGGFVRPFERWKNLLRYDKNGNGKIDWFEADAYRQDLRRKLIATFDDDKDGKLAGDEREQANRALARGWMGPDQEGIRVAGRGGDRTADANGGPALARGGRNGPARLDRAEILKKYDKDGDGKLSDEELQAATKDFQEGQRQEMLRKYDKDGDGQLNEEERAAMQADMRKQAQPWKEMTDRLAARIFDAGEDGQLTEKGKADAKEFEKEFQKLTKEWDVRFNDLDGDGNVTPEERKEVQSQWRRQALRILGMTMRYMDGDGDGQVTAEEREAFMGRLQTAMEKWANRFVDKYDFDGDGKLSAEERAEMLQGLKEEVERRIRKHDTEGKGRLTPAQTLDMVDEFGKELGLGKPNPVASSEPSEE